MSEAFSSLDRPWFVYILECVTDSGRVTVHVGVALDPNARLRQHQAGKVKATAGRMIHRLGVSPPMGQREAMRLESRLKCLPPSAKREQATAWMTGGG